MFVTRTTGLALLVLGAVVAEEKLDLVQAKVKSITAPYYPENMIDGNPSTFAHTDPSNTGMWLRVWTGFRANISRIEIHNREDCCKYRLVGYTVWIRAGDNKVTNCGTIKETKDDYIIKCNGFGDNIEVSKDGRVTDYQNIAEIKVYGTIENAESIPKIILYDQQNYKGKSVTLQGPTSDFKAWHFDNKVESVWAVKGNWELYGGFTWTKERFFVEEGQKMNVKRRNFYSSARPATCRYVQDPETAKIRVATGTHFQGAMKDIVVPIKELDSDWDNSIASLIVDAGDWELYSEKNFAGNRLVVKEGEQVEEMDRAYFYKTISSLRPICEYYKGKEQCSVRKMEMLSTGIDLTPEYTGTEIIGSQSSGSCYGPAIHEISITQMNALEESVAFEVSSSSQVNWNVGASVEVETTAGFLGSGVSVSMGVSANLGGAITVGNSEAEEEEHIVEKELGQVTEFKVPGAGLLFGIVDRYEVKKQSVPMRMYLSCPDGTNQTVDSTMDINKTSYGAASFWSMTGEFTRDACRENRELPSCVEAIRKNFGNFVSQRDQIEEAFEKCFEGKGTF